MKKLEIPFGAPKEELFAFLLQNKAALIQQKKLAGKECDGFAFVGENIYDRSGKTIKAAPGQPVAIGDELNVKAIINTTNWMDSHLDVHLPKLWKKNLSENKFIMHLQEHDMSFDKIISDGEDLKAYTKNYTWKALGFDYQGSTEALVFDSVVKQKRNPYMFSQYAEGYVKNHSVYMQYVKMVLCINEPDSTQYGAEYEAWEKYLPEIVNKEFAEEMGFFWAILEAKIIEGSAVPRGSNIVTPTLAVSSKNEPPSGTLDEPVSPLKNVNELLNTKKIF